MKILMLNYEFPPIGGGAGHAHLRLLREYVNVTGLKVDVLTSAPKPGFSKEQFSENITIYKVGLHKKDLHYWRRIEVIEWLIKAGFHYKKLLKNNSYDLAHAFFGFPTGWLCYRAANKLTYMVSLRGSDVPGKHARLKLDYKVVTPIFKAIWTKAVCLVACSEGLKNRASRFLPSAAIKVIPNGVELDRFHPSKISERQNIISAEKKTFRLLTVGRLSVTKRVELLIAAVKILRVQGHDIHFTIIGGGLIEQQLRKTAIETGLSDIIELTGRVEAEKMPQLYRQHDIFISASMQEGMSNAMLEAMASGLPIITTRCEGVEELIEDNGFVVESPEAESIAQAIKELLENQEAYERMSIAARRRAEKFSWSSVAHQYLQLYDKLLKKTS
jgi:glycosyltransferase involved in cell wall biosynthesis